MPNHASDFQDALIVMERAGIQASCVQTADTLTAAATDGTGHDWRVTADTALQAVTELMETLGFEHLD
jgi:hypothetical protein